MSSILQDEITRCVDRHSNRWNAYSKCGRKVGNEVSLQFEKYKIRDLKPKRINNQAEDCINRDLDVVAIPGAKIQYFRDIQLVELRKYMDEVDLFFAKYITYHPSEIPRTAHREFNNSIDGDRYIQFKFISPRWGTGLVRSQTCFHEGDDFLIQTDDGRNIESQVNPHQVYDEIMMHKYLSLLGLLVNEIEPAILYWNFQGITYNRMCFTINDLNYYENKGLHAIFDRAHIYHEKFVCHHKTSFIPKYSSYYKSWFSLLDSLVRDVNILVSQGIYLGSYNIMIIEKVPERDTPKGMQICSLNPDETTYVARLFPFKFSHIYDELTGTPATKMLNETERFVLLNGLIADIVGELIGSNYQWYEVSERLVKHYLLSTGIRVSIYLCLTYYNILPEIIHLILEKVEKLKWNELKNSHQ